MVPHDRQPESHDSDAFGENLNEEASVFLSQLPDVEGEKQKIQQWLRYAIQLLTRMVRRGSITREDAEQRFGEVIDLLSKTHEHPDRFRIHTRHFRVLMQECLKDKDSQSEKLREERMG